MKRTVAREIAVRLCFAVSENPAPPKEALEQLFNKEYYSTLQEEDKLYAAAPDKKQKQYINSVVTGVYEHISELDTYIEKHSVGWKSNRISKTAKAIMRIAMYEVLYMQDIPTKVAINEAVELAKKYESPETCSFINGILGSFSRALDECVSDAEVSDG